MNTQKQEIYNTRKGGLGGSDAKFVLKIGRNGLSALSEGDKRRLAVLTGQIEYQPTATTAAMEAGNEFERWLAENYFSDIVNNAKIGLQSNPFDFDVFAHADFYDSNCNQIFEAKYTSKTLLETAKEYEAQLQWYFMLEPTASVVLMHAKQGYDFISFQTLKIDIDEQIQKELWNGLKLINDFIKDWVYVPKEEWTETDLLPFEQEAVELMYNRLTEIKKLEAEIDNEKKKLLELFKANNVKSLKTDMYQITYVPESITRTFDKSSFFKAHPELAEEAESYHKISPKADYLKITIK